MARQAGCLFRVLGACDEAGISCNDTTIADTLHSVTHDWEGLLTFAVPDKFSTAHASPLHVEVSEVLPAFALVESQHGLQSASLHVEQWQQCFASGEQARSRQQQEEVLGRGGCRSTSEACLQGTSAVDRPLDVIFDAKHETASGASTLTHPKPDTKHSTSRATGDSVSVSVGRLLDATSCHTFLAASGAWDASHVNSLRTPNDFLGSHEQWLVTTEHAICPSSLHAYLALSSDLEHNLWHSHEAPQSDQHPGHRELQRIFSAARAIPSQWFRNPDFPLSVCLLAAA